MVEVLITRLGRAMPSATARRKLVHTPLATWLGVAGLTSSLPNLAVFAPFDQYYLLQARQMQAL
jgi:hypothetical protein